MRKTMLLPFAAAFAAVQASFAVSVPYAGQTVPGEYTISTYGQLTNFTQAVRGTHQNPGFPFTNSTITLTADIDCNGGIIAGHERQGNYYEPSSFSGVFDGSGHTIRNYSVNVKKVNAYETGQVSYGLAMFDVVKDGAVIRNLKLDTTIIDRADATSSYPDDRYYPFDAPCAAAFAMYAEGANAVTFENCTFKGMVSYHGSAAAFVGKATRNPADAPGSHSDVGGLYDDNHLIADLALAWIAAGAKREGLRLRRGVRLRQTLDTSAVVLHDSHDEASNLWGAFDRVRRDLHRIRLHIACKGI